MITLSQLTDNSWTFKAKDISGILFKKDSTYNLKTPTSHIEFNSLKELELKYGNISYKERITEDLLDNINGYPVKDKNYKSLDTDPPSYVKINSYNPSKISFNAGFWSIKYPNGWALNLCPKTATVEQYESQGPFRTRLECVNNNNILNTRENVNGQS